MTSRWVRAPIVGIVERRDSLTILGTDGLLRRLDGDSAELCREVLAYLDRARTRDEIHAQVTRLAGEGAKDAAQGVVDELLSLLERSGVIRREAPTTGETPRARVRIVLGITGAVASAHAPALVLALQRLGADLEVMATRAALRFVGREALEAITHRPLVASTRGTPAAPVPHLRLAEWADAVVVYPASATTISRIARGDFSDVVAAVAQCARGPVFLAPSMNPRMARSPAVRRNLETLRGDGYHLIHAARGAEVADDPAARAPVAGAAPPVDVVANLVMSMIRHAPAAPADAAAWDALYASTPDTELSWHQDDLDEDLAASLAEYAPPPASLLDVGTGTGTAAVWAARRGYRVVATDVSDVALSRARSRADDLAITWLHDDITDSRLASTFDVVLDRACLHLLPERFVDAWGRACARLVAPGGVLVVKTDALGADPTRATRAYSVGTLATLLGTEFTPVDARDAVFTSPRGHRTPALTSIWRRTGGARPR